MDVTAALWFVCPQASSNISSPKEWVCVWAGHERSWQSVSAESQIMFLQAAQRLAIASVIVQPGLTGGEAPTRNSESTVGWKLILIAALSLRLPLNSTHYITLSEQVAFSLWRRAATSGFLYQGADLCLSCRCRAGCSCRARRSTCRPRERWSLRSLLHQQRSYPAGSPSSSHTPAEPMAVPQEYKEGRVYSGDYSFLFLKKNLCVRFCIDLCVFKRPLLYILLLIHHWPDRCCPSTESLPRLCDRWVPPRRYHDPDLEKIPTQQCECLYCNHLHKFTKSLLYKHKIAFFFVTLEFLFFTQFVSLLVFEILFKPLVQWNAFNADCDTQRDPPLINSCSLAEMMLLRWALCSLQSFSASSQVCLWVKYLHGGEWRYTFFIHYAYRRV